MLNYPRFNLKYFKDETLKVILKELVILTKNLALIINKKINKHNIRNMFILIF